VDGGRFPIQRTLGEEVAVEVDLFADGHDAVAGVLRYRHEEDAAWSESPLRPLGNDRFAAAFVPTRLGRWRYAAQGWVDRFASWRRALARKLEAGQDVAIDLRAGADLVDEAARRATGPDREWLAERARRLRAEAADAGARQELALDDALVAALARHPDRSHAASWPRELIVVVDPERARFSAWYEMFPRSASPDPKRPGTLKDVEDRLPYVASMGFDVLYLPPIHPIGRTHRKGRNGALQAGPADPGSPWAIGAAEGGHTSVDPALGTVEDLERLVRRARSMGIEVALDLAFQCSPDHPWVREHPAWFRHRPDGSIQFAENPPKQYQDIYPLDFESAERRALADALLDVVRFWIARGVRVFRVDNPHTKPFAFWEWLIAAVKRERPEILFLSEAFTRPRVQHRLTRLGFSQSYTYFAWRNTKAELTRYFTELGRDGVRDTFRPSLWPNTPDILTEVLQSGGRPGFQARLVLAATLGASYGVYGPAFELCEARPRESGSEEYLDSEKYQVRHWDLDRADSLRDFIARVNRIRRENPALQGDRGLRFHVVDHEQLIAYSKRTADGANVVLTVVNLDPHHRHSGWVELTPAELGVEPERPFQAHDLLSDARYLWTGGRNFVELDPQVCPAHVFQVRRRFRTEHDFDYYL
jgi:starch synthase (maltosyl-transferring)